MKRKNEKEFLSLVEKKGKYKSGTAIFSVVSIMMLFIDIMLCVVNFPFVRFIFNTCIVLSLCSIIVYVAFDYKLENTQKYLLYLEDKSILSDSNIKECLNEKEISRIYKERERYSSLKMDEKKMIKKIPLNTIIKLREYLEINNI